MPILSQGMYVDRRAVTSRMIELNLSIADLAERMSIPSSVIYETIYSGTPMKDARLKRLAKVLKVDAEQLTGEPTPSNLERIAKLEQRVAELEEQLEDLQA